MSGYGRGVAEGEGLQISFELRSVNHRFFRLGLHLPAGLSFFETTARQLIADRVQRGKVDLTGTIRCPSSLPDVRINEELAASYAESLAALAGDLGIEPEIDLAMLADLPGVVSGQRTRPLDPHQDKARAKEALSDALNEFEAMRTAEGAHLADDMKQRFEVVTSMLRRIEELTADLPHRYRDLLLKRIENLMEDVSVELDPGRLAQEVAHFADRCDIAEELVRLRSHIHKAGSQLENGGPVGRPLEFLLQEMHREINTIGAKAKVAEIGDIVVDVKCELERIREQVQNVE
tara:strand:+ start:362 stop:1234 length:873 start_codon:yes stop_codon:yes gene_type:complete